MVVNYDSANSAEDHVHRCLVCRVGRANEVHPADAVL